VSVLCGEGKRALTLNKISFFGVKGVSIPVAVSMFPDELYPAPWSWAERAYPKLIYYNKLERGGHYSPPGNGRCSLPKSFAQASDGRRIHNRVPNAGHALPQQAPKVFADAVTEVTKPV
jgi:hypothetical protein